MSESKYLLENIICDFHVLERLTLGDIPEYIRLQAKQMLDYIKPMISKLLFDYTFAACLGEARHSYDKCEMVAITDEGELLPSIRNSVYEKAHEFDPHKTLPKLIELFNEYEWETSYGGSSWSKIAETAYKWLTGELTDTLFIDTTCQLTHNGGLYFDKGYLIDYKDQDYVIKLLDYFRHNDPLKDDLPYYRMPVSKEVYNLLQQLARIGIITHKHLEYNYMCVTSGEKYKTLFDTPYGGIQYGDKHIILKYNENFPPMDYEDEEDYSETIKDEVFLESINYLLDKLNVSKYANKLISVIAQWDGSDEKYYIEGAFSIAEFDYKITKWFEDNNLSEVLDIIMDWHNCDSNYCFHSVDDMINFYNHIAAIIYGVTELGAKISYKLFVEHNGKLHMTMQSLKGEVAEVDEYWLQSAVSWIYGDDWKDYVIIHKDRVTIGGYSFSSYDFMNCYDTICSFFDKLVINTVEEILNTQIILTSTNGRIRISAGKYHIYPELDNTEFKDYNELISVVTKIAEEMDKRIEIYNKLSDECEKRKLRSPYITNEGDKIKVVISSPKFGVIFISYVDEYLELGQVINFDEIDKILQHKQKIANEILDTMNEIFRMLDVRYMTADIEHGRGYWVKVEPDHFKFWGDIVRDYRTHTIDKYFKKQVFSGEIYTECLCPECCSIELLLEFVKRLKDVIRGDFDE